MKLHSCPHPLCWSHKWSLMEKKLWLSHEVELQRSAISKWFILADQNTTADLVSLNLHVFLHVQNVEVCWTCSYGFALLTFSCSAVWPHHYCVLGGGSNPAFSHTLMFKATVITGFLHTHVEKSGKQKIPFSPIWKQCSVGSWCTKKDCTFVHYRLLCQYRKLSNFSHTLRVAIHISLSLWRWNKNIMCCMITWVSQGSKCES